MPVTAFQVPGLPGIQVVPRKVFRPEVDPQGVFYFEGVLNYGKRTAEDL